VRLRDRKPWQKKPSAPNRLGGRKRQRRNERIKLRDRYTCQVCHRITTDLEVDHIVPLSQGGTEDDTNLQSICAGPNGCHERKSRAERGEKPIQTIGTDGWPIGLPFVGR
jgi:5-methylcytosine-specific restriction protein A